MLLCASAAAAEPTVQWRTGGDLARQLTLPMGLHWQGVPLREALRGLAETQRVAIFLDRRVDPSRPVRLDLQDVTLQEALARIAASQRLGVTQLGPVFYFGPLDTTRRLRTLATVAQARVEKLSPATRAKYNRPEPWAWERLSEPRALIEQLAAAHGVTIENPQLVPHDLWPAASLPPMTLIRRLTLALAGFDLTLEVAGDGSALVLLPIGDRTAIVRAYVVGPTAETVAARLRPFLPGATIRALRDQIVVRGRVEDHRRVAAFLAGGPVERSVTRRTTEPGVKAYTLTVENKPLGPVVRQLVAQLGYELEMDDAPIAAAGIDLNQIVSFQVEKAPLEKLLQAMLRPHRLDYRVEGRRIKILPAKEN
jgi:hypothetical protein